MTTVKAFAVVLCGAAGMLIGCGFSGCTGGPSVPRDGDPSETNVVSRIMDLVTPGQVAAATEAAAASECVVSVTPGQVKQLSRLELGKATRTDVVRILGEPSHQATEGEVRANMELGPNGKEEADRRISANQEEWGPDLPDKVTMHYDLSRYKVGAEVRLLTVFLSQDQYKGYQWDDPAAAGAEESLLGVRPFMVSDLSIASLQEIPAIPSMLGHVAGKYVMYVCEFQAPQRLRDINIPVLRFWWVVKEAGRAKFHGMSPLIPWRYDDPFTVLKAVEERGKFEELGRQYNSFVRNQASSPQALTSGRDFERASVILNRLIKVAPDCPWPVRMVLLDKPEVNAYAGKTDTGRVIVLTTGFLKELKSDDELACVIGHELGHMVCHHTCFEMGSILSALPTPNMFAIAQGMEYEADARGFELMAAGGYDAKAFRAVLAVFASKEKPIPKEVSRHPSADLRTKFLEWYYAYRSQAEAKGPSSAPETRDKVAGPKAEGGD